MVFGLVGCGVLPLAYKYEIHTSHQLFEDDTYQHFIYEKYDDIDWSDGYWMGGNIIKIEAMTKDTGEFYFRTYDVTNELVVAWGNYYLRVLDNCKKVFNSDCVITRSDRRAMPEVSKVFYLGFEDYKSQDAKREKAIFEAEREMEERKLAVIHALKERCVSFGFSGSNNIAACVQREAQHDYEIEQKEYELQLAKQQLLAQQNQQQVEPEMPWYLIVLEALAKGIEKGYEQQALINAMDARYERKDIWRYCRPKC